MRIRRAFAPLSACSTARTLAVQIAVAVLLAAFPFVVSGSDSWRVTSWTTDDALPQGSVYAIRQTRDGYLWLTTLGGLVRYDGLEFTVLSKATAPGLRSNRFTTLCETADGSLCPPFSLVTFTRHMRPGPARSLL